MAELSPGSPRDDSEQASEVPRLLSFYDRLRERIFSRFEERGGKTASTLATVLLLVPDVFMFLVRLSLDREVPRSTRSLVAGALAYFLLPADLLPEAMLGVGGFVDDLILAAGVLAHALGTDLERHAERHWSGSQELRAVLRDVTESAHALLGENLYARLQWVLERRGIEVPAAEAAAGGGSSAVPDSDSEG
jgi:uncharacterized membrane protein YkvA (DUF1232 family)